MFYYKYLCYYLLIMEPKYLFINIIGYYFFRSMSSTHFTQDLVEPTNVASTSTTSIVRIPISSSVVYDEKSKKLNGLNFKKWQQKILFYQTILNSTRFFIEKASKSSENESEPTAMLVVDAWNNANFVYKNYILNGLNNTLYNVYGSIKSVKSLWETLDKKV